MLPCARCVSSSSGASHAAATASVNSATARSRHSASFRSFAAPAVWPRSCLSPEQRFCQWRTFRFEAGLHCFPRSLFVWPRCAAHRQAAPTAPQAAVGASCLVLPQDERSM